VSVYDLHIWGRAAVALLCPVTGNNGIQKNKNMGEEGKRPDKPRYIRLAGKDRRSI
jgi:hypothetical protein